MFSRLKCLIKGHKTHEEPLILKVLDNVNQEIKGYMVKPRLPLSKCPRCNKEFKIVAAQLEQPQ